MKFWKESFFSIVLSLTFSVGVFAADKKEKPAKKTVGRMTSDKKLTKLEKPNPGNGARIFFQSCAMCHGVKGDGNGKVGKSLKPQPTDFTKGKFKYGDSEQMIALSIKMGRGPMTGYSMQLSEQEIVDVAAYVSFFGKGVNKEDKNKPTNKK